jgi:predicted lipoprotein with Yx(FWY)xxD motif
VEERVLADGLDPSRFGSVEGPSGPITTYMGWPLYSYPSDTDAGMIKGQGKQGLWFAAEVQLPAIIPMRAVDATVNHLATSHGYPLYVHALDTLGTSDAPPVSACTDACAERHVPLISNTISVASAVEASDLSLFLRADNQLQVAYKGAPLYLDVETPRPGVLVTPMPEQWGVALK